MLQSRGRRSGAPNKDARASDYFLSKRIGARALQNRASSARSFFHLLPPSLRSNQLNSKFIYKFITMLSLPSSLLRKWFVGRWGRIEVSVERTRDVIRAGTQPRGFECRAAMWSLCWLTGWLDHRLAYVRSQSMPTNFLIGLEERARRTSALWWQSLHAKRCLQHIKFLYAVSYHLELVFMH